jgi:hypothetical protein
MSTKSKKRQVKRHRIHRKPTEAVVQKILRAQAALMNAIKVAPGGELPNTPRVRRGWKRLWKAEKESR